MKLEDFVKGLKVGEYVKIETTDEKNCVLKFWRTDEGKYGFALDFLDHYGEYETAGKLLDYIAKHFANWLECDYEIYKTRAEVKAENEKLKKALKSACKFVDCRRIFRDCPCEDRNKGQDCTEFIFEYLMKEAAKND